jgi:signal peptidase II
MRSRNRSTDVAGTRRFELGVAVGVVIADQATKLLVRQRFELFDSVSVIPGFFNLTRIHNTGAAFGMLNAVELPMKSVMLGVVAAIALVGLALYAASLPSDQKVTRLGLALIIGGAAGNLIDRVISGYVVDFVDLYVGSWHFWAFNVADAAITVGVALMILDLLGVKRVSRAA